MEILGLPCVEFKSHLEGPEKPLGNFQWRNFMLRFLVQGEPSSSVWRG